MSYERENFTTVDEHGVDPLSDIGLASVQAVTEYKEHRIGYGERARPDTISYNSYGTTELWWAILSYNGITDVRELVEGKLIRIPNRKQISDNLSQGQSQGSSNKNVSVRI